MTQLLDVARELTETFDKPAILRTIVASAARMVEADVAAVRLVTRDRHLAPMAWAGISDATAHRLPTFSADEGWLADVLRSRRTWCQDRLGAVPEHAAYRDVLPLGGHVVVPLTHQDQALGVLSVGWSKRHDCSADDLSMLETLASHAAVALHNAQVFEESERWSAQLAVVQSSMARLNRLNTVESIGQAIVQETARVVDYHNCRVYLLHAPDILEPIAFQGEVGAYREITKDLLRVHLGEGFTGWVAANDEPILTNDADSDPRGANIPGTESVPESMIVVPMHFDQAVIGVITLSKLGLDQFDERDLRLMLILADAAGTAIESAVAQEESARRAEEMRSLLELSSAVAQTLDPQRVADLIAEHMVRALGGDSVSISRWDRTADIVSLLGEYPPNSGDPGDYRLDEFPESRRVLVEQASAITIVGDPRSDRAEVAFLERTGYRASLMVPLVVQGESTGLVEVVRREARSFDAEAIRFATTMANEAAIALENARLYEEARELADRDPLTNFYNHRYLHERLGEEILRSRRSRRPVALLMIDLDDFKLVNDTLGHQVGDQVLRWAAELIRSTLRESDVPARYGGDEFAVILPDADATQARTAASRIMVAFAEQSFRASERGAVPIGASIGISAFPEDARTASDLVAVADRDLYRVKGMGDRGAVQGDPEVAPRDSILSVLPGGPRPA